MNTYSFDSEIKIMNQLHEDIDKRINSDDHESI